MGVRKIAALAFVSLAGALNLYLIVRHSLPAYLAQVAPEAAVRLRPSQPDALIKLVEQMLDPQFGAQVVKPDRTDQPKGDQAAGVAERGAPPVSSDAFAFAQEEVGLVVAQYMAEKAARADPLNARAFRLLGEVAARRGEQERAFALMKAAARRSLHESGALLALLRTALVRMDYGEAAYDIDALLRVRPKLLPYLVPALAVMSERPEARPLVIKLIEADPPWREGFFEQLPRSIANVHTPGELLLGLEATSAPPTRVEISAFLSFLVSKRLYQEAYGYWVQFLSPQQLQGVGLLYNGDFRQQPTGLPFDWDVRGGLGYTAEIASGYLLASNRGLNVQFNGTRTEFRPISELLVLAPGTYIVKGSWRGNVVAQRGLVWQVRCVETETVLGNSSLFHSSATAWTPFQYELTVPAVGCPAQKLALVLDARSQFETLLDGSIWFANLEVRRE